VAPTTAVHIKTWPQSISDLVNLVEYGRGGGEKSQLTRAETGKRAARARSAASRTRVNRLLCGSSATAAATASPAATTVIWRDILSDLVMQIEVAAIPALRKGRPRQGSRPQHHDGYARKAPAARKV
jgi:hypothetical protein